MLCPINFRVMWRGGQERESLIVELEDDRFTKAISSHFGGGVLTFGVPYFFRTDYPYGTRAEGPTNFAVPGAHALTGLIETYGHVSTFTMNWRITDVDRWVEFRRGWPILQVSLFDFSLLESVDPEMLEYESNPQAPELRAWCEKRDGLLRGTSEYKTDGYYTRHRNVAGEKLDVPHWTRFNLANFQNRLLPNENVENNMPIVTSAVPPQQPTPTPEEQQETVIEQAKNQFGVGSFHQQVNRLRGRILTLAEQTYAAEIEAFRQQLAAQTADHLLRYTSDAFDELPDVLAVWYLKVLIEKADSLGVSAAQWQTAVDDKMGAM